MKILFLSIIVIFVSSCGGDAKENSVLTLLSPLNEDVFNVDNTITNSGEPYDGINVLVTRSGTTVNISNTLSAISLSVSGSNNLINVLNGVSITSCEVSGDDNTLDKPSSINFDCNISGVGNIGFE